MESSRAGRRAVRRFSASVGAIAAAAGLGTATVGLALPATPASAASSCASVASFTWTGGGSVLGNNNWNDPANWQGAAAPTSGCVSLMFPSSALATGTTNNDVSNLEITSLSISGPYNITGSSVFMGDSGAGATVTDTANATISLTENVRNNTIFNVSSGNTLSVAGQIVDVSPTPATAITSEGSGVLNLSTANTFTGNTVVSSGTLAVGDPSALGVPANAVTVQTGANLRLGPYTNPAAAGIDLQQPVTLSGGTVLATDISDQLGGGVNLTAGGTLASQSGKSLLVSTAVTGTGPLTVNSAANTGTVTLGGASNGSYTGGATVSGGTLKLAVGSASASNLATPGTLTVGNGAAVVLAGAGQLDPSGTLTLIGSASLDLAGHTTTAGNLTLDSTSTSAAPTVKDSAGTGGITVNTGITSEGTGLPAVVSSTLQAPSPGPLSVQTTNSLLISGQLAGGPLSLVAPSSGTPNYCTSGTSTAQCVALVLSGNSPSYAGPLSANAGVLDVTGNLSASPVTLGGGTLTGTGSVGGLTVNSGTVAPGTTVATAASHNFADADSPGVLKASSLTMNGGTLTSRLDGTSPGNGTTTCSGYDQIDVTGGSVNLTSTGATVNIGVVVDKRASSAPCSVPANLQQYTVISNAASGATESGTFTGVPEGGAVTDSNFNYQYNVTYAGGTPPASVVLTSDVTTNMTLSSNPNPSTYGQQVAFTATVSPKTGTTTPTGTVAFIDDDNGQTVTIKCQQSAGSNSNVVTLSSDVATCTPVQALPGGTNQNVTANYSGDSNYPGNSASTSQTVNKQPTTTAITGGTPNPSTYGQSVTFKATVSGVAASGAQATTALPSGTVTFSSNGNPIPDCSAVTLSTSSPTTATCNTVDLPGGHSNVTATYNGDGNYGGSTTSQSVPQTVNPAKTTLTIAADNSNPDPSSYGQPVSFTATISPATQGPATPSGSVTFDSNGAPLADCTAVPVTNSSTTVTCTSSDLSLGTNTVTASYSGDTNYSGSISSNSASQTVDPTATSTDVSSTSNPGAVGQAITYTATVTPTYAGAQSPTGSVAFQDGTTTIPGCSSQAVSTTPDGTTATCTVSYSSVGQHSINATYSGDPRYTGSATTSALVQQVDQASTTTSLSEGSPNPSFAQQQVTFVATVIPDSQGSVAPTGTVVFSVNGSPLSGCSAVPVSTSGGATTATCQTTNLPYTSDSQTTDPVTAAYSGDNNFAGSTSGPVSQTVTLSPSQIGAEPRIAAFQASGGDLWTVGTGGWVDWHVGVAPGTSPAVAALPNGGYQIAFQASGGDLWTVGTAGWVDWHLGVAPGTSPAIVGLPNGGYEIAFQASGSDLWTVGTAGWTDWHVGVAPGTNPAVVGLPNGGYEIAFQANGANLWTIGAAGWTDWGLQMAPNTSPSIALNQTGGLVEGIQSFTNDLRTVGSQPFDWQLGMAPGTSPSMI